MSEIDDVDNKKTQHDKRHQLGNLYLFDDDTRSILDWFYEVYITLPLVKIHLLAPSWHWT